MVEIAHQPLHALAHRLVQQMPVEAAIVIPLALLRELAAHEQELLARMRPHEPEIGAQIGEALPTVARHAADERALAVHHFVVGQRQNEVFRKGVDEPERQIVVMMPPVNGVLLHVTEGVVHPPHVPLEAEAEAAGVGRL